MSWAVVGIALLMACVMALAMFWQIMRRREAVATSQHYQLQMEQLQQQSQQQEADLREQTAAARAEKAHAEQLQRQLEFAQEEVTALRDEQRIQRVHFAEVQSQASIARAQQGRLVQQYAELKMAYERLLSSHEAIQDKFASLSKDHANPSRSLEQKQSLAGLEKLEHGAIKVQS